MAGTLDEAGLARLAEDLGGEDALDEVVSAFLADADRLAAHLRGGEEAGERSFVRALHTLRSSSAMLGAHRLSRLCREAEDAARAGDVAGARARVPQVLDELARAAAALRARRRA